MQSKMHGLLNRAPCVPAMLMCDKAEYYKQCRKGGCFFEKRWEKRI